LKDHISNKQPKKVEQLKKRRNIFKRIFNPKMMAGEDTDDGDDGEPIDY